MAISDKESVNQFERYKDNIKHRIKNDGQIQFIREKLLGNEVEELWNAEKPLYALYLLAMIDYLSRLNDIPLYNKYDYIRSYRMEQTVYPISILITSRFMDIPVDSLITDAIPEFKKFNIIEGDVFNVQ